MRLLFLIGNGFDMHVGLKTSFPEFLKYYLLQPVPSDLDEVARRYINRLKEDIKENIQLWSNLELRYGQHMSKLGSMGTKAHTIQEELDIINDDIRYNLSGYIAMQDAHSFFDDNAKKRFLDEIIEPERNLRDFEITEIKNRRNNNWNRTANRIDFITFNYTRTIEHLIGKMPVQVSGFDVHEPIHVHGYHDKRMVMGVNDVTQIKNEKLRQLTYATDALVKPDNNHSYGVAHTKKCESLIRDAQMICCYGLSFGVTDKMWWERVCYELQNRRDLILIVFSHEDNMPDYANNGHKIQNKMRQIKNDFLSKGGVEDEGRLDVAQRIFVTINDPIFNIHVDDRTDMEKIVGESTIGAIERFEEMVQNVNGNKV